MWKQYSVVQVRSVALRRSWRMVRSHDCEICEVDYYMKPKPYILDLFLVGGYAAMVYGCFLYSTPLGWIIGGTTMLSFALHCRKTERGDNDAS